MENTKQNDNVIARIPLTGGPKGGKTVIKEKLVEHVEKKYGYKMFIVPETATEFIKGRCIPPSFPKDNDPEKVKEFIKQIKAFQYIIWDLQLTKERDYDIFANAQERKAVIGYDRATVDNYGYLLMHLGNDGTFQEFMAERGLTLQDLYGRYDGVISLGTSAKLIDFNEPSEGDTTVRLEAGGDEAALVDYFVSKVWKDHPNYRRVEATPKFEDKIDATIREFDSIIDECKVKKLGTRPY